VTYFCQPWPVARGIAQLIEVVETSGRLFSRARWTESLATGVAGDIAVDITQATHDTAVDITPWATHDTAVDITQATHDTAVDITQATHDIAVDITQATHDTAVDITPWATHVE